MNTLHDKVVEALSLNNETWEDVDDIVVKGPEHLQDVQLFQQPFSFNSEYDRVSFTVWTANFVYFPALYDGHEWVAYVPRNPNGEATTHIGGE